MVCRQGLLLGRRHSLTQLLGMSPLIDLSWVSPQKMLLARESCFPQVHDPLPLHPPSNGKADIGNKGLALASGRGISGYPEFRAPYVISWGLCWNWLKVQLLSLSVPASLTRKYTFLLNTLPSKNTSMPPCISKSIFWLWHLQLKESEMGLQKILKWQFGTGSADSWQGKPHHQWKVKYWQPLWYLCRACV